MSNVYEVKVNSPPKSELSTSYPRSDNNSDHKKTNNEHYDSDIQLMLQCMPDLGNIFTVHYKLGEGTFSSVYMCSLKCQEGMAKNKRKQFAVKYLIPTSHPKRIERELKCLQDIGGVENVVGIDLCLRHEDSVAFVMPCQPHNIFHDYVFCMGPKETQIYIKNLLIALRRVHSFNIIHRDVKPSNFLYDRKNQKFLLVDFGLAQNVKEMTGPEKELKPLRDNDNINKRKRSSDTENVKSDVLVQATKKTFIDPIGIDFIKSPLKQININNKSPKRKPPTFNCNILKPKLHPKLTTTKPTRHSMYEINIKRDLHDISMNYPIKPPLRNLPPYLTKLKTSESIASKQANRRSLFLNKNNAITKNNLKTFVDKSENKMNYQVNNLSETMINDLSKHEVVNPKSSKTMTHLNKKTTSPCSINTPKTKTTYKVSPISKISIKDKMPPVRLKHSITKSTNSRNLTPSCICYGRSMVCNICLVRKGQHAARAGTPGFRSPEVLLRYQEQTTAVDIWASGVIFLCLLSRCYPFFRSPDDMTALGEIITLFGVEKVKKTALALGRQLTVSYSNDKSEIELDALCKLLRSRPKNHNLPKKENIDDNFPPSAYNLLSKLLDLNPHTRITAENALEHEFFKEELS